MSDPTDDAQARVRTAADQFGAAIAEAFNLGLRKIIAKELTEAHGPGPWVLYPDGRIEPHLTVVPKTRRTRKDPDA